MSENLLRKKTVIRTFWSIVMDERYILNDFKKLSGMFSDEMKGCVRRGRPN